MMTNEKMLECVWLETKRSGEWNERKWLRASILRSLYNFCTFVVFFDQCFVLKFILNSWAKACNRTHESLIWTKMYVIFRQEILKDTLLFRKRRGNSCSLVRLIDTHIHAHKEYESAIEREREGWEKAENVWCIFSCIFIHKYILFVIMKSCEWIHKQRKEVTNIHTKTLIHHCLFAYEFMQLIDREIWFK